MAGMMPEAPLPPLGSWRTRRRFMFAVALFNCACVAYVLGAGQDTRVAESVIEYAMGCNTLIVGGYCFARVMQDVGVRRAHHGWRRPYRGVDNPDEVYP